MAAGRFVRMMPASIPYCGSAPMPGDWLSQWNLDPVLLGVLLLAGWWASRRNASPQMWLALGGLAILFLSPLCALSSALFWVRVAHHVVLTAVIAPLLISVMPRRMGGAWLWAAGHALVFWFWHAPDAYAAALSSSLLFWMMQLSLLLSACALWAAVSRASGPVGVAALLATTLQMGLLGALLTFAGTPLYVPHYATTITWGLSPLEDQQLAGLIMWVVGSGLYLGAAMRIGWRWFGAASPIRASA